MLIVTIKIATGMYQNMKTLNQYPCAEQINTFIFLILEFTLTCKCSYCQQYINSADFKGAQYAHISQHHLMSIYSSEGTWLVTSMLIFLKHCLCIPDYSSSYFVETCMLRNNLHKLRISLLGFLPSGYCIDHNVVPLVCLGIVALIMLV